MKSSGIGGQAVIEGIMMKNNDKYSVAVRKPDKEIEVIEKEFVATTKKYPILNIPIIRGVVNFVDSLRIGMSTLTYSSSFYEEEEEPVKKNKDKAPKKDSKKESKKDTTKDSKEEPKEESKDKFEALIIGVTVILSVILAIALFMLLPYGVSRLFGKVVKSVMWQNVIEGVVRLLVFLIYVVLIAQMEDIKRVFMYHGAEHKAINCIEHGLELNVENVKKSSRYHKRCGTSFMLFIMIISIIVFMFIDFENRLLNMGMRVILVPVIAGISYEILKIAGSSEGFIINLISKPGMWLQGLTTKEPDEDMIEVAIVAIEKVFDWKAYLEENAKEEETTEEFVVEPVDMGEIDKINSIEDINDIFENNDDLEAMEKEKEAESQKTQPKKPSKNRRNRNKAKAKSKKNSGTASNEETQKEEAVTQELEAEATQEEIKTENVAESLVGAVVDSAAEETTEPEEVVEETTEPEEVVEETTEPEEVVEETTEPEEVAEETAEPEEAAEETAEPEEAAEETAEPEEVAEETIEPEEVAEETIEPEEVAEETIEPEEVAEETLIIKNNEEFWEEELQIAKALKSMLDSESEEPSTTEEVEAEVEDELVPEYVLEDPIVEDLIFDDDVEEETVSAIVEEAVEEEAVAEEVVDSRPENPIATEVSEEIEIQEYVTLELPKRKSFSTRTYTKRDRKRW